MPPNKCLENASNGKFQFRPAYLNVGIDDGFGGPLTCHGVHESSNAYFTAEGITKTDVGIASIGGCVNIGIEGWSKYGIGGIILSKGVEGNGIAHLIANRSTHTILRGEVMLPRHPILVCHNRGGEYEAPHLLAERNLARCHIHQSCIMLRGSYER